jgi:hypothetical protein
MVVPVGRSERCPLARVCLLSSEQAERLEIYGIVPSHEHGGHEHRSYSHARAMVEAEGWRWCNPKGDDRQRWITRVEASNRLPQGRASITARDSQRSIEGVQSVRTKINCWPGINESENGAKAPMVGPDSVAHQATHMHPSELREISQLPVILAPCQETFRGLGSVSNQVSTAPERNTAELAAGRLPALERVEQIRQLAGEGHQDTQIAQKLGISAKRVRELARQAGIRVTFGERRRAIDINRVMEETCNSCLAISSTIDLLEDRTEQLDKSRTEGWIESLRQSATAINEIIGKLQGMQTEI